LNKLKEIEIEKRYEDTDYPYRSFVILLLWNIISCLVFYWNMLGNDGIIWKPYGFLILFNIIFALISIYYTKQKKYFFKYETKK
jgi:hypothetical protein